MISASAGKPEQLARKAVVRESLTRAAESPACEATQHNCWGLIDHEERGFSRTGYESGRFCWIDELSLKISLTVM